MVKARRLDHFILETDDIFADTDQLTQNNGFQIAWPIGPFWPNALTNGINVGAFNLELLQPLGRPADLTRLVLVFEPESTETGEWSQKFESNPALLAMRGFPRSEIHQPHLICRNTPVLEAPVPHFFCDYVPFLRERLHPQKFRGNPARTMMKLALSVPTLPENLMVDEIEWSVGPLQTDPTLPIRQFLGLTEPG
jgi:hypothetical protein